MSRPAHRMRCHLCQTSFAPDENEGACPECGYQVVPQPKQPASESRPAAEAAPPPAPPRAKGLLGRLRGWLERLTRRGVK